MAKQLEQTGKKMVSDPKLRLHLLKIMLKMTGHDIRICCM